MKLIVINGPEGTGLKFGTKVKYVIKNQASKQESVVLDIIDLDADNKDPKDKEKELQNLTLAFFDPKTLV